MPDSNLELLIPIVAIVMTMAVPIAWFYFHNRSKEARYRAMERMAQAGQDPKMLERLLADEPASTRPYRRQPYRSGLICCAIGAAFLIAGGDRHNGPEPWVGLMLVFLGLALMLGDFMNRGQRRDRDNFPPPQDPTLPS